MSFSKEITIRCDAPKCGESVVFTHKQAGGAVDRARWLAKRRGWVYKSTYPHSWTKKQGGSMVAKDFCPEHHVTKYSKRGGGSA